jgi:hypothetical protein
MKSPPDNSVGFMLSYLFDSIFKEYSDPAYPRSDVIKLCDLFSGGESAIMIAPLLNVNLLSCYIGTLLTPTIGTFQAEYLP